MRSSLARHWHAPLSDAERAASRRRAQARSLEALAEGIAVVVLDEISHPVIREAVEQEARKQAGIDIGGRT